MIGLRRSLIINFFSSSGATLIQFIVSVLLARLLSPHEIGIFSITVVFVNIAHIFRDFGVTAYLQREPNLTPDKVRAANGVLFTCSWIIAGTLYFCSDQIAGIFNEAEISEVMKVLAIGFIFIPFSAVTHSLLTREFAADKQAVVTAVGTLAYAITALGLASLGHGPMSLAWANLVNILACAIAYTPFRPKNLPWLPSFKNWRHVLNFGLGSLLANCAVAINNAIPDLLLGKLANARQVGLLSRANSTVTIFTHVAGSTVNYGAISYISQIHHSGASLTPLLNKANALLTGVGWPVLAITALLGQDIVLTLYGSDWLESVPAIPWLAAAAAITMMFNYTPTALLAVGRPYISAYPIFATVVFRIALGIMLFDGSLKSFSIGIFVASVIATPVMFIQQKWYLHYSITDMLKAVAPSAIIAALCMAVCQLTQMVLSDLLPAPVKLIIATIPITLTWYLALKMMRHPVHDEIRLLATKFRSRYLLRQKA